MLIRIVNLEMLLISIGKFNSQCLSLINHVAQSHDTIIITKHDKPLVKVVPIDLKKEKSNESLKNAGIIIGDIVSPIDEEWDALK